MVGNPIDGDEDVRLVVGILRFELAQVDQDSQGVVRELSKAWDGMPCGLAKRRSARSPIGFGPALA